MTPFIVFKSARLGFEPKLSAHETNVLPLHHLAFCLYLFFFSNTFLLFFV